MIPVRAHHAAAVVRGSCDRLFTSSGTVPIRVRSRSSGVRSCVICSSVNPSDRSSSSVSRTLSARAGPFIPRMALSPVLIAPAVRNDRAENTTPHTTIPVRAASVLFSPTVQRVAT